MKQFLKYKIIDNTHINIFIDLFMEHSSIIADHRRFTMQHSSTNVVSS